MDINEVLEYAKTDESFANSLKENFTVEKEVVKEVQTEYTEEGVSKFLETNQSYRDKYNESVRKNTYKKLLGKDEITDDDMKTEFVTKSMLDEANGKINTLEKEYAVKSVLGDETFEQVKDILNLDKIQKGEDGKWQGLDVLERFKTPSTKTPPKAPTPPIQKTDEEKKKEKDDMMMYKTFKAANLPLPKELEYLDKK